MKYIDVNGRWTVLVWRLSSLPTTQGVFTQHLIHSFINWSLWQPCKVTKYVRTAFGSTLGFSIFPMDASTTLMIGITRSRLGVLYVIRLFSTAACTLNINITIILIQYFHRLRTGLLRCGRTGKSNLKVGLVRYQYLWCCNWLLDSWGHITI